MPILSDYEIQIFLCKLNPHLAIPILQVGKLRPGGGKQQLAQVHTAHQAQTQDWSPGFPFPVQSCLSQKTPEGRLRLLVPRDVSVCQ